MSPATTSDTDSHDLNTEIALFRYGLIAQLIHMPPDNKHRAPVIVLDEAHLLTQPMFE